MKGLLLKDFYMMRKYCRAYFFVILIFLGFSFLSNENMFFLFYPCLFCGMLPVTLMSYDEHSKWHIYSGTLPYTKAQLVSGKFLLGLIIQTGVLLLSSILQPIRALVQGGFFWQDYLVIMAMQFILSTVTIVCTLPFMFKFGVEKGRIAYYVMIGIVCSGSVLSSQFFELELKTELSFHIILLILCIVAAIVYLLAWRLSIRFYEKREIR